ncbi:hypothetical protein GCM10009430_34610 [Aquimarina litoralis]|uniref:Uncharacterized protein n=1 Tax=Aquimarina litoralis TaxID=584605 RepID=A0ABN1J2Q3_9FLAO
MYIVKTFQNFSNRIDSVLGDNLLIDELKQNFKTPLSTTEKKYHFKLKEISGRFLPKYIIQDSVVNYDRVVKGFLTWKYGNSWRKNEFDFKF